MSPDRHDRLFRTDSVRADLRGHSVRSGFIAIGARVAQALLQLAAVIVLARVLTPADFGIIAYVVPVAVLVTLVANNALQSALIHRDDLDQDQASSVFRQSAVINLGLCAVLVGAAPLIARFYGEPRASAVTIAWAAAIWIAALGAVPEALLKRQMRFGVAMSAHLAGLIIGTGAAVVAAFAGARYWALLIQVALPPVLRSIGIWWASGWRPSAAAGSVRPDGTAAVRRYWSDLAGFRLVSWAGDQADRVLVGLTGSAAVLGLYDGARRWGWYPLTELIISLNDVAVSSFSRVQDRHEVYRGYVRKGLLPVLALPLPMLAFIYIAAEDVIFVVLGDQWVGAAPFVRLMCIAAFVGAPNRLMQWVYLSRGQTGRQLRWAVFQTVATVVALGAGALRGPIGVATAFAIVTCLLAWPGVVFAVRGSPLSTGDIAQTVARPAVSALGAAALLYALLSAVPQSSHALFRLGTAAIAYAILFIAIWIVLPGGRTATREAIATLRELDPRHARGAGA